MPGLPRISHLFDVAITRFELLLSRTEVRSISSLAPTVGLPYVPITKSLQIRGLPDKATETPDGAWFSIVAWFGSLT